MTLIKKTISEWWHSRRDLTRGLILTVLIIIGVILLLNLFFYTTAFFPKTCTLCHIMKPYYDNWKTSTHNKVNCIECHSFKPTFIATAILKYATGTYNPRPHAVVENSACVKLGCHNERLSNGKTTFKGSIIFDHDFHISKTKRGEKLRCATCHSQIVQGEHISVTEKVCFLCHFKGAGKGQSITGCPSCHGTPKKIVEHEGFTFSHESYLKIGVPCNQCHIEVASGDGYVPDEKCHYCHVEKKKADVDFRNLHKIHVTEKQIYCFNCHEEIKHGSIRLVQPFEVKCESCHEKKHSPQKELYMGVSGRGVSDTPSRMFAAQVSCDGCHTTGDTRRKYQSIKKACVDCHGEKYDLMLDDWKREITTALRDLSPVVNDSENLLNNKSLWKNKKLEGARELFEDVVFNYTLVKEGKGEHNVEYAVKLLSAALDQYEIAKKTLSPSYTPLPRPELLKEPDGYCAKLCHNRLGLPEKKFFEEMHIEFPHKLHAEEMELGCAICHSPEKHKMRVITKEGCMNCHHSGENLNCKKCHPLQTDLYTGEFMNRKIKPDVMYSGGISCNECHNLKEKEHTIEAIKVRCAECHNQSYSKLLIDWEKTLLQKENELTLKVTELRETIETLRLLNKPVKKNVDETLRRSELILKATGEGRGVHNYPESIRLMDESLKEIDSVLEK